MSTETQRSRSKTYSSRIDPRIFLLALGMFALGTDAFVIAGVLPVIAHTVHVTTGTAGQLVTVFSLTYGLGAPFLAALTARLPRNRLLLASLGAFCVANVCSALAPTFGLLLVTRILAGCCAAVYAPLAYTVGTSLAPPERRGQTLALIVGGLTVATVFGAPLGTWIGHLFGWQMSFVLVALLSALAVAALLLCGLPSLATPPALSLRARLAPIGQPRLLLALAPSLLWYLGVYIVYTYLAPILQQGLHVTDISSLLLFFGAGVVLGNWFGGYAADRFGPVRPMVASLMVLTVILTIVSIANSSLVGECVALFILGASGSLPFIPQQYRLMSLAPEYANVILALNNSTLYLGIAGGAAVGGVVMQYAPVSVLGWIGAACAFLALLTLFQSWHTSERERRSKAKILTNQEIKIA